MLSLKIRYFSPKRTFFVKILFKVLVPKKVLSFGKVTSVTAGQYCTFVIQSNGSVVANGKGSLLYIYTRLKISLSFGFQISLICHDLAYESYDMTHIILLIYEYPKI